MPNAVVTLLLTKEGSGHKNACLSMLGRHWRNESFVTVVATCGLPRLRPAMDRASFFAENKDARGPGQSSSPSPCSGKDVKGCRIRDRAMKFQAVSNKEIGGGVSLQPWFLCDFEPLGALTRTRNPSKLPKPFEVLERIVALEAAVARCARQNERSRWLCRLQGFDREPQLW